jgi:predicted amidohydrolase
MSITATLAALQPLSSKTRAYLRRRHDPALVTEHFQKYNIGSATYDREYCVAYGNEYLAFLDKLVRQTLSKHAKAGKPIDLLLLPEFCFTPGLLADPMTGIARNKNALADAMDLYTWSGKLFSDWLCDTAKSTSTLLGATVFTIRNSKMFNTGLLADDTGKLALTYHKVHLPDDELKVVTPGDKYPVADTRVGRVGFSICYDVQFPEHHAVLATQGVQVVLHPSAGYTLPDEKADMGQQRLRVRASDHHAALVYSCFAPESDWNPRESCVISPSGHVLACVRGKKAGLAAAQVTLPDKRSWPGDKPDAPNREAVRRSLRRPDTYRHLTRPPAPGSGPGTATKAPAKSTRARP